MITDLLRSIDQISRDKGINPKILIEGLEEAVRSAVKRKFGPDYELEVNFNIELGEIEVFEFKEVVEKIEDDRFQITLEKAKKLDPDAEVGDSLGSRMDIDVLGRIAAQSAKQVIMQRLREAERDAVYEDFKDRRGEIVNGIVQRFEKSAIIANLGKEEAELPVKEQITQETYTQGDRIRAYIYDVKQFSRGPQIMLSRTHPNFLSTLFESEVPEISDGIVTIKQVAREPGSRSKIAVFSKDKDIDPVGACVGMKGSRVQAIVQELRGEKIDIVTWVPDPAKFVCNALAPAEILRVIVDEEKRVMEVVVPDDQLSLAIGKKGQNVRLASRLSGWKLDVTSDSAYQQALEEGHKSLLELSGIGEKLAKSLFDMGFGSISDIAKAELDDLASIKGISEKKAEELIQGAIMHVESTGKDNEETQDKENEGALSGGLHEQS
ncbi:MAG: transcription termination factor NusA [Thermodesulfobacteriota bacterium]|nr:transcription termination factor NusA [Thermodesulfobacteriota bacterium]